MKKLIAILACLPLLASPAHAQKTPTALISEVDLNLADNTSGLITPAIVRTILIDIINSMLAVLSSPAINSTFNSVYGTPTVSAGACGAGSNGSIASGSVNQSGQVDIGASATTFCVVTFVPALTSTPDACILFPQNATAAAAGTTVARVATATNAGFGIVGSALANANYWWHCF